MDLSKIQHEKLKTLRQKIIATREKHVQDAPFNQASEAWWMYLRLENKVLTTMFNKAKGELDERNQRFY